MDAFIKLKKILKNRKPIQQFRTKLINYNLTEANYLSLLLANTIELNLQPFNQYLKLLLEYHSIIARAGANINFSQLECKDLHIQGNINLLMHASQKSNFNIVADILQVQHLDLNFVDSKGRNPLYYALVNQSEQQSLQILKLLLEKRPNLVSFDYIKRSPKKTRKRITLKFVYKNNDYRQQNFQYQAEQIQIQRYQKQVQIFAYLLGRFPIEQIIEFYQAKIKQKLSNSTQKKDYYGQCQQNRLKTIMFFVQNGADLDLKAQCQMSLRQLIEEKGVFKQQELLEVQKKIVKIKREIDQIQKIKAFPIEQQLKCENQFQMLDQERKKDLRTRNQTVQCNQLIQTQRQCNLSTSSLAFDSVSVSSLNSCDQCSDQQQYQEQQQQQVPSKQRALILTKEIQIFGNFSQKTYQKAWSDIQPFIKQLQCIAKSLMLQVDMIGSFATGLWTPFSDIDFVLVTNQPYVDISNTLGIVFIKLKKLKTIKQIFYIEQTNFPNIKIELSDKFNNLMIDVAIFHIKNNGKKYVHYINQAITFYPQIRHIYFFLRALLQNCNLHDRKRRGLKTYSLFLMIYPVMHIFSNNNLGELIVNITRYYGFIFQYAFQSNQNCEIARRLNILDPLNFNNNAGGKNIDIESLQNMFRTVYYGIHLCPLHKKEIETDRFTKDIINNVNIYQDEDKQDILQNMQAQKLFLKDSKMLRYLFQLQTIY